MTTACISASELRVGSNAGALLVLKSGSPPASAVLASQLLAQKDRRPYSQSRVRIEGWLSLICPLRLLLALLEERKQGGWFGSHGTTDGVEVFPGMLDHLSGQMLKLKSSEAQFRKSSIERNPQEDTNVARIDTDAR